MPRKSLKSRKTKTRKQKLYKMKGCYKRNLSKNRKTKTKKMKCNCRQKCGKNCNCNCHQRQRGGLSLIPPPVTNIGRDLGFNFKSAYNALNGYKAPINPLPYNDQFPHSKNLII
jgi:hypothetical protein